MSNQPRHLTRSSRREDLDETPSETVGTAATGQSQLSPPLAPPRLPTRARSTPSLTNDLRKPRKAASQSDLNRPKVPTTQSKRQSAATASVQDPLHRETSKVGASGSSTAARSSKKNAKATLKIKEQEIQRELVSRQQALEQQINMEANRAEDAVVWTVSDIPRSQTAASGYHPAAATTRSHIQPTVPEENLQEALDELSFSTSTSVGEDLDRGAALEEGNHRMESKDEMILRLQAEVARMRLDMGSGPAARGGRKKAATSRSALPLASGLIPPPSAVQAPQGGRQRDDSSPAIGGLTDDDINDVPPPTARVSSFPRLTEDDLAEKIDNNGRNSSRRNMLVNIPQIRSPVMPAPALGTSIKTTQSKRVKKVPSSTLPAVTPTITLPRPCHPHPKECINTDISTANTCAASSIATSPSSNDSSPTTAGKTRKGHLPQFIDEANRWEDICLPSLYALIWVSQNPFGDFKINTSSLQGRIQQVVDAVYPHVDYALHAKDPILLVAHKRIVSKRGEIASAAIELLVQELKSHSSLIGAAQWLQWAQRLTGPLYFENPTPASCRVGWDHPEFVPPHGRMKSPILIALVRKFLLLSKDAIILPENAHRRPVGLVALAMTALHRAARFLQPNGKVSADMTPFSGTKVNAMFEKFIGVARGVAPETWDQFLVLCNVADVNEEDCAADTSFDDRNCHRMYEMASPQKATTSRVFP